MSSFKFLKNAPILEAILQVKYKLFDEFDVRNFYEIKNEISNKYPLFRQNFAGEITIQDIVDGKKTASIKESKLIGYLITSNDKKSDCNIETDKFTFSKHGNYTNWEDFIYEANYIWKPLSVFLKDIPITRISARFINRIEIYENVTNPVDYINTSIFSNNDALPEEVDSYFINYRYKWGENKTAVINQKVGPYANDIFSIIFDIDVLDSNVFIYSVNEFNRILRDIQLMKDEIFFKNLTKKTIKLLS